MINFRAGFKSLWGKNELDNNNNLQSNKTRTTSTYSLRVKSRTITHAQKMEESTINNEKVQQWLDELDRQVIANISKINFTIEDLATYMGISKRQLYRLINERLGETPHTYLKNYRLNYAKELLENQQVDSVKAAAYSTGFPNTVYFSRQFKAAFGYLPSDLL